MSQKQIKQGDQGGEGNYDATRRYNEGLEKSVEKGNAEELGKQAKQALQGEEGAELRRAEEQGKQANVPGAPAGTPGKK